MTEDLSQSLLFAQKVLRLVPGMIYVFNQHTQSNEYANRSMTDILGYQSDETRAMGDRLIPGLCHPDDLPGVLGHFEAIKALEDDEVISVEYRMKHKAGHWVWLLSHDTVFDRAEDGSVLRHIGKAFDISDIKAREIDAEELSEEYRTVFNAATSGIVALSSTGQITRVNNQARHLLGGVSDEVPFDWPESVRFLEAESMKPLDASADPVRRARSGHLLRNETHLMRRVQEGDDTRYVRVTSVSLEGGSDATQTVLVIDDVSNEERNRQVVERKTRLDALGQLTGGIAHDFNNLLASQIYAIDLARRAGDAEKRDRYLRAVENSINRGRSLTAQLLAFAKKQPALASVKQTSLVFKEFGALVKPMLEASIEVKIGEVDPELRHFCDQTQLETALMNLVLNSRDAILRTGRGNRIDIQARAVRSSTRELDARQTADETQETLLGDTFRYVEIRVADNGPGMDAETLARCTDPFFTTKDTNSGTGLGLAIVYGFMRQADGDLRIYSEEGIGTTVQLTLPRGTEEGARESALPPDTLMEGNGETLLLVEDEYQLQMVMADVLRDLNYVVITAASGSEALRIAERGDHFDLLLTDVVMPGTVGGFELARELRRVRPRLPVIYMSGYTGFTAAEMGTVQAPLLQKPAPPAELAEAVSFALSQGKG
ncbi:MAG: ATP-binding protein [Pseudomonadota bacterium]